jgi:2-oxoglutarate dehydrogenase E2 component (dihydrolipoamide succinyltransferase)
LHEGSFFVCRLALVPLKIPNAYPFLPEICATYIYVMIEIKVPTVGESINEVTLIKWLKNDGEYVERDEVIAELESEKATFELNAEQAGVLKTVGKEGDTLNIGDVVAQIDDAAAKPEGSAKPEAQNVQPEAPAKKEEAKPAAQPQATTAPPQTDVKATPVASAIIADKKSRSKGHSG